MQCNWYFRAVESMCKVIHSVTATFTPCLSYNCYSVTTVIQQLITEVFCMQNSSCKEELLPTVVLTGYYLLVNWYRNIASK